MNCHLCVLAQYFNNFRIELDSETMLTILTTIKAYLQFVKMPVEHQNKFVFVNLASNRASFLIDGILLSSKFYEKYSTFYYSIAVGKRSQV